MRNSLIKDGGFLVLLINSQLFANELRQTFSMFSNLHRCYIQLSDKLNNSRFFIESFL